MSDKVTGMRECRRIDFRYAPPVRWTCIGRPDDVHKTIVAETGALLYDFDRDRDRFGVFRFARSIQFGVQVDHKPVRITQETECARSPIVRTGVEYPNMRLDLIAFGRLGDDGKRTDVVLWRITVAPGGTEALTGIWLCFQDLGRRFTPPTLAASRRIFAVAPEDVPKGVGLGELYAAQVEPPDYVRPGELVLVSSPQPLYVASPMDFGCASGLVMAPALIREGKTLSGALMLPLNHSEADEFGYEWAMDALEGERSFWANVDLQPLAMTLPDKSIEDMIAASARNILQAREVKDGHPEFQVGPTVYRGLWVVDGHFFLEAARYLGWRDDAHRGLDALLKRADPKTGRIEEIDGHLKETGVALATLARQTELSGDDTRLDSLWPVVQRAVDYIQGLREASKERGPVAPEYGLMPCSVGDGGLGGRRAEYTTALWTLIGLKEIAKAAQRLGHERDHGRFQAAFEDLLRAFRAHAVRDMGTLPDGTPYLPMSMPGSGNHHWIVDHEGTPEPWRAINPVTATWALAHAIYPGEIFAPDDPIVQNFCCLLDQIDDEEGIPVATGWLPYKSVWSYSSSFYAHVFLYAGRPEKAIDYLYAFANHASPCRVWREEQSLAATHHGQFVGDMPHNWASVEFIRLVRHLLVFERGDVLELLPGLPMEWIWIGRPVRLEKTPTRFGPVDLTMELEGNGSWALGIRFDTQWIRPPAACRLHAPGAREGNAGKIITVDGKTVQLDEDGAAFLPFASSVDVRGKCGL